MLFDTHCHFDTIDDAKTQLPSAYENGLRAINIVGVDAESSKRSIEVARLVQNRRHELGVEELDTKATVGLHPHEAKHFEDQHQDLKKLIDDHPDLVAGIGETGYDFYYNHSDQYAQTKSFIWHIELAKELNKCLVIHTRDAWSETFALLDEQKWPEKTVFHCFTGGPTEALRAVENNAYISISGIVTFKNAQDIREAVEVVPLTSLLIETDAPYLTPAPHRGTPNEPSYVSLVADMIVDIRTSKRNEDEEEVRKALFDNAIKAFR